MWAKTEKLAVELGMHTTGPGRTPTPLPRPGNSAGANLPPPPPECGAGGWDGSPDPPNCFGEEGVSPHAVCSMKRVFFRGAG